MSNITNINITQPMLDLANNINLFGLKADIFGLFAIALCLLAIPTEKWVSRFEIALMVHVAMMLVGIYSSGVLAGTIGILLVVVIIAGNME